VPHVFYPDLAASAEEENSLLQRPAIIFNGCDWTSIRRSISQSIATADLKETHE
jgi:hypothetical protein